MLQISEYNKYTIIPHYFKQYTIKNPIEIVIFILQTHIALIIIMLEYLTYITTQIKYRLVHQMMIATTKIKEIKVILFIKSKLMQEQNYFVI